MGFKAEDTIEPLDYDFRPHAEVSGTIPEPSSKQVNNFREKVVAALTQSGLDPEMISSGKVKLDNLAQLGELMKKSADIEDQVVVEVANLTGIATATLKALPFRIKTAFVGWVMGIFFNPEA